MKKALRPTLIILGIILLGMWLMPRFFSADQLTARIISLVLRHAHVHLNPEAARVEILPQLAVVMTDVGITTTPTWYNTLGFSLTGRAPRVTVAIDMIDYLRGTLNARINIHRPVFEYIADAAIAVDAAPPSPPAGGHRAIPRQLTLQIQQGEVKAPDYSEIPWTVAIDSFSATASLTDNLITLTSRARLPHTPLDDNASLAATLQTRAVIETGLPFRPGTGAPWTIRELRLETSDLRYQSRRFHIRQQDTPLFVELSGIAVDAEGRGVLPAATLVLDTQRIHASGEFQTAPFVFVGEIKPFDTGFDLFPYRVLTDLFPGYKGVILMERPLAFSYEHQSPAVPFSIWKFQLDGLRLVEAELPLPWLMIQAPLIDLRGQLHLTPQGPAGAARLRCVDAGLITPEIELTGEWLHEAATGTGSLLIQPFDTDLAAVAYLAESAYDLADVSGTLRAATPLVVNYQTAPDTQVLESDFIGRIQVMNLNGLWKNRWRVHNMSANILFEENTVMNHMTADLLERVIRPDDARAFFTLQISDLNLKTQKSEDGLWHIRDSTAGINAGQFKIDEGVWRPDEEYIDIARAKAFFENSATLLNFFESGWEMAIGGSAMMALSDARLPLAYQNGVWTPVWHQSTGKITAQLTGFQWMSLAIEPAFRDLIDSFIRRYSDPMDLTREDGMPTYAWHIEPAFRAGRVDMALETARVVINSARLETDTTMIDMRGEMPRGDSPGRTALNLTGTLTQTRPGFLRGTLRRLILDDADKYHLPVAIEGSFLRPRFSFLRNRFFETMDQKAKEELIR